MRAALALLLAAGFATAAEQADSGLAPEGKGPSHGFSAEEIKAAVESHVRAKAAADDGIYRLEDDRTGQAVSLELVSVAMVGSDELWRVHNPARQDSHGDYFACASFRAFGGPPGRLYDVDLLLAQDGGRLIVREVFVHKEPQLIDGQWVKVVRSPPGR